jgi:hypothetical protein
MTNEQAERIASIETTARSQHDGRYRYDVPWLLALVRELDAERERLAAIVAKRPDQIIIYTGGGDWADASVDVFAMPANIDVQAMWKRYGEVGGFSAIRKHFGEWVRENGARELNESDPVQFIDDTI